MAVKYCTMQPLPLWPVMFYDFDWDQHPHYEKDLKAVCHRLEASKAQSNVARDAKRGLYESTFDFATQDDTAVRAWADWAKSCVFQAAKHANQEYWPPGIGVKIDMHESWCHITRDGGYHDMHTHPNSSWSLIYYVDIGDMASDPKNGANRFYNPCHNMYLDAGTAWNTANTSIDFIAQPGMMIVFPSWVQHNALVYRGTRDRIVIAANVRIERIA